MEKPIEKPSIVCNEQDIVFDIKYFIQDFYFAKFIASENHLQVNFDNGQKFIISVREL